MELELGIAQGRARKRHIYCTNRSSAHNGFGVRSKLPQQLLGQTYLYRRCKTSFTHYVLLCMGSYREIWLASTPRAGNVRNVCFEVLGAGETPFPVPRSSIRHYQSNEPSIRLDRLI